MNSFSLCEQTAAGLASALGSAGSARGLIGFGQFEERGMK
jgi:hypothetical protein